MFDRRVDGRELSFPSGTGPAVARDRQTGSAWDITGRAIAGPLERRRLERIVSDDQFWFALAAFFPEVEIRG